MQCKTVCSNAMYYSSAVWTREGGPQHLQQCIQTTAIASFVSVVTYIASLVTTTASLVTYIASLVTTTASIVKNIASIVTGKESLPSKRNMYE